jgi:hypothetical protein
MGPRAALDRGISLWPDSHACPFLATLSRIPAAFEVQMKRSGAGVDAPKSSLIAASRSATLGKTPRFMASFAIGPKNRAIRWIKDGEVGGKGR